MFHFSRSNRTPFRTKAAVHLQSCFRRTSSVSSPFQRITCARDDKMRCLCKVRLEFKPSVSPPAITQHIYLTALVHQRKAAVYESQSQVNSRATCLFRAEMRAGTDIFICRGNGTSCVLFFNARACARLQCAALFGGVTGGRGTVPRPPPITARARAAAGCDVMPRSRSVRKAGGGGGGAVDEGGEAIEWG